MHGNVSEWCQDFIEPHYGRANEITDPKGPPGEANLMRVLRGGWFSCTTYTMMSGARDSRVTSAPSTISGFRVARSILSRTEIDAALAESRIPERSPPAVLLKGTLAKEDPLDSFKPVQKCFHQVHLVPFESGKTYVIDLEGVFDTFLRIEDSEKKVLLFNDDVSPPEILNSRLVFTPSKNDTYRLVVTAFKPQETGSYSIAVRDAVKIGDATVIKGRLKAAEPVPKNGKFHKIHRTELVAGSPYVLELASPDFDATFLLVDGSGRAIAQASTIAGGPARLDFTPAETDDFRLMVTSSQPGRTGEHTLTVQRYQDANRP